ncbi:GLYCOSYLTRANSFERASE [Salix purpurea]|uniref:GLYCOSYLTRANSFERASE n=1 Tax=Salix purpurea TaxID=77065 RepID=A0A9Q1A3M2_SALPP|nr:GLYCOSYLTRANSFERASE [Salix purpurea]
MKRAEVVLVPIPAMGHIVALVEVAKLLVQRDDRLSTTVFIMHPTLDPSTTKYTQILAASTLPDRMQVINLPNLESIKPETKGRNWLTSLVKGQKSHVREYVSRIRNQSELNPDSPRIAGFIFDTFATGMKDVPNEFGVPWYVFSASGAAFIGSMLHLTALHDEQGVDLTELKNSEDELGIPCFAHPIPAKLLPSMVFEKESQTTFLEHARILTEARGDGGDLLSGEFNNYTDIMEWLDDQPPLSVMFLCFGSWGSFKEKQVREIAIALEHSGHRFLWSLRKPSQNGKAKSPSDYENFQSILPEAVEIKMDYRKDFYGDNEIIVSSEDILKAIKSVMEEDSEVRKKVKEMSRISEKNVGGRRIFILFIRSSS